MNNVIHVDFINKEIEQITWVDRLKEFDKSLDIDSSILILNDGFCFDDIPF